MTYSTAHQETHPLLSRVEQLGRIRSALTELAEALAVYDQDQHSLNARHAAECGRELLAAVRLPAVGGVQAKEASEHLLISKLDQQEPFASTPKTHPRYEWREGYGLWDRKNGTYLLLGDNEHARILWKALQSDAR